MSQLRIMTFNVHNIYAWEQRASLNIETIQRYSPDLIGFQELHPVNLAAYQQHFPEYHYLLAPKVDNGEPYSDNAIFWKPQRLTLLDSGGFWLSETPDRESCGWGSDTLRTATWARFCSVESGKELLHINTHLDHRIEEARVQGIRLILQRLVQPHNEELPIVLTGDFNSNPDTAAYHLLQANGFEDTYRVADHEDKEYMQNGLADSEYANTVHSYGWRKASSSGAKITGSMRFDWICLRDPQRQLRITDCDIIRDAQPPLYPSDHYPVLAIVEIS